MHVEKEISVVITFGLVDPDCRLRVVCQCPTFRDKEKKDLRLFRSR